MMNRRGFGVSAGWLASLVMWRRAMGDESRADWFGDLLPARSICRFGSLRFWNPVGGLRNGLTSLAVSPDGRLVAGLGSQPAVVLWHNLGGRVVRHLEYARQEKGDDEYAIALQDLAFSSDGRVIVAGGPEGRIIRWEVATGRPLEPFTGTHLSQVVRVAFSRNGEILATGDRDGLVLVRDAATGQVRHRLGPHEDHVAGLAVSHDGGIVISGGWNRSTVVSVWDAATGRLVRELDQPPFGFDNHSIALSPDGTLVAAGREGYEIVVWDARTGKVMARLDEAQEQEPQEGDPHEMHDEVACVAFSPDGRTLASAGRDESVRLWDVATWVERTRLDWYEGEAEAVAFSPDGATLVAAGGAGVVRVWALPDGRERIRIVGHRAGVTHLSWTPEGKTVVSVGDDAAACLIDASTGDQLGKTVILPRISYSRALSPDGRLVAFQGLLSDRRVNVMEAATGRAVRVIDLRAEEGGSLQVCFSEDSNTLYVGDIERHDGREIVIAYDLDKGMEVRRIEAKLEYFHRMRISPDGRFLGTTGGHSADIFDLPSGRLRFQHTREHLGEDVIDLSFSPDGATLAIASRDGNVSLRNLPSGRKVRSLDGHQGGAIGVAFSPDGTTLASGSFSEGVVRLWNVASGREIGRLQGHRAGVNCLAFAPDGRRLATGSSDTTVIVWSL